MNVTALAVAMVSAAIVGALVYGISYLWVEWSVRRTIRKLERDLESLASVGPHDQRPAAASLPTAAGLPSDLGPRVVQRDGAWVVYPSPWKVILILLSSLIILAVGAGSFYFRVALGVPLPVAVVVFVLAIPLGSFGAAYSLFRLVVRRPALVISADGIVDHASAAGVGFLPWSEIDRLVVYHYSGQKYLGIIPRHAAAIAERLGSFKSFMLRLNSGFGLPPVNIPQLVLPVEIEKLRPVLEQYGAVVREGLMPESLYVVTCTELGVSCARPDGSVESVTWDDLERVVIVTTDAGPAAPDVFWILHGSQAGCVAPQGATGEETLMKRLQALPGFDNAAVMNAMGSTSNQEFLVWQKPAPLP